MIHEFIQTGGGVFVVLRRLAFVLPEYLARIKIEKPPEAEELHAVFRPGGRIVKKLGQRPELEDHTVAKAGQEFGGVLFAGG